MGFKRPSPLSHFLDSAKPEIVSLQFIQECVFIYELRVQLPDNDAHLLNSLPKASYGACFCSLHIQLENVDALTLSRLLAYVFFIQPIGETQTFLIRIKKRIVSHAVRDVENQFCGFFPNGYLTYFNVRQA